MLLCWFTVIVYQKLFVVFTSFKVLQELFLGQWMHV